MRHLLTWSANNQSTTLPWITESELPPPQTVIAAGENLAPETFYQKASEGFGFVWEGDFEKAKQLLQAVQKKINTRTKSRNSRPADSLRDEFHRHRQAQSHRARLLSRLLIRVAPDFAIHLPRSPNARAAISEAFPDIDGEFLLSLRDLLGVIGAHEWRKKGVLVPALGEKIFPHYGVFSPARGEYLDLIKKASLPKNTQLAFDIGTGTGVIAAILARRGVPQIIATEFDKRAISCANENLSRLKVADRIQVLQQNLFPHGRADLIVCNPPWLPARPTSSIEHAVYDEQSKMLRGFLSGIQDHLQAEGEAWLVLSDLGELLGLRASSDLPNWIAAANLEVIQILETRPQHPKTKDVEDPLFSARSREITKLWQLRLKK